MPVMLEPHADDPTKLNVFVTPHQEEFASEDTMYCCWFCACPAQQAVLDDECPGKIADSDSP